MEYVGRMYCDGNGNLLASEGEHADEPIAYDPDGDRFVFVQPGEPSHNERHHQQFATVVGTQSVDPELPGYAGTPEDPVEGAEHHFGVLPDDPHFEEGAVSPLSGRVTNTRLRQLPDKVAMRTGGHTHQHKAGA